MPSMKTVILMMRWHTKHIFIDVISPLLCLHSNLTSLVATEKGKESDMSQQLGGLNLGSSSPSSGARPIQPPRPAQQPQPEEPEEDDVEDDENNPFADSNALSTPAFEKSEPRW